MLAALGIALSLMGVLCHSSSLAVDSERDRLGIYANKVLDSDERSYTDAVSALRLIEADAVELCSPDHIGRMRNLTLGIRGVDEIGYFQDGILKCTSWGLVEARVPRPRDCVGSRTALSQDITANIQNTDDRMDIPIRDGIYYRQG